VRYLREHMQLYSNNRIECTKCDETFSSRRNLGCHFRSRHTEKHAP
jgi:hypothetical protein